MSPPAPPTPADGGPIPPGLDFTTMPYLPTDATRLVSDLAAARTDPAFIDAIDPARRDDALAAIDAFVARPDAVALLTDYISERRAADAAQRTTGRLPAPPSATTLSALGLGDPVEPPAVEPPPVTVPGIEEEAPPAELETVGVPSVQVPGPLEPVSTVLSGSQWPIGGPSPWPVGAGSKAEKMAVARAGSSTLDPAANCTREATGTRHLPSTPIPSFESRVYTPAQGTFASSGAPGSPAPGVITNYHGELVTRPDPSGSGIVQMKVEAHLLSPTVDPLKTATARLFNPSAPEVLANPNALRGHVVVEGLDGSTVSYFPGSPATEWKTLCYAEDLGVTDVKRAYVEAWVPMRYPSVSDPRNLREPGFQVRYETVDSFWNPSAGSFPTFFYAAEQATVILQGDNPPLAHDAPVPGGSAAVRVADEVIVDRDGVPTNDLESILRSKVEPAIAPALDSFDNTWIPLLALGVIIWIQDVKPGSASLDLDIRNIGTDDEAEFVGKFSLSGLRLRGLFTSPVGGCGYSTTVNGTLNVLGQINRKSGDITSLQIDGGHYLTDVSTSKTSVIGPGLIETGLCWAAWWGGTKVALGALDSMARGRFDALPDTKLSNTVDLQVADTIGPGTSAPGGGGFGITNVGFERSCFPKGCQGGDLLIDADGLAPAIGLAVNDNVPATGTRRFPLVYNPTLRTNLATLYNSAKLPDQRPYKFAGFLHPTLVNQILRALAEGNGTPGSGLLERSGSGLSTRSDVAPILVTPSVSSIEKPLTVLIPDLRVSDGTNEFAVDITAGVELTVDAATRKLRVTPTVNADVETLQCGLSTAGPEGWVASYSLCASRDWYSDPGVALPSIPDTVNFAVNEVVLPLLRKSLGEVEVPQVEGFDLLSLGSSKVANVEGFPSVFVGYPQPSLDVEVSSAGGALLAHATATGLPGTGAIDYSWSFSDMHSPRVYRPLGSGDAQSDALSLYSPSPSGGFLWLRKFGVNVTVTASRGGETRTATTPYVWYRP